MSGEIDDTLEPGDLDSCEYEDCCAVYARYRPLCALTHEGKSYGDCPVFQGYKDHSLLDPHQREIFSYFERTMREGTNSHIIPHEKEEGDESHFGFRGTKV